MIAWGRSKRTTKKVNYSEQSLWSQALRDSSSESESDKSIPSNASNSETEKHEQAETEEESYSESLESSDVVYSSSMRKIKKVKFSSDEEPPKKKKKQNKKKSKPKKKPVKQESSDYSYNDEEFRDEENEEEEEKEPDIVQNILGIKEDFDSQNDETLYYVKFHEKSYIHCKWLNEEQINSLEGGEAALRRFKTRSSNSIMTHSLSIPSLVSYDETIVNSDWYEVDRIINDACEKPGKVEYLVKWKSLDYIESTWELEEDIKDKAKIEEYRNRLRHSNPKKIPTRYKHPPPNKYEAITEPVNSKVGTTLREYQLEGLNWLLFCWYNRRNSILADEMGLGKTAQLVCMLNTLATREKITGPFLVVAPLSTLPHWKNEFERWTDLNCIVFHGDSESRKMIIEYEIQVFDERARIIPTRVAFDVMVTNYDIFRTEYKLLQSIEWRYLVVDEGHKLKNYKTKIYQLMQSLTFEHCTLLTGTPLQNDMTELWSLLHFLNPEKFNDLNGFMKSYGNMEDSAQVKEIQKLIGNIMLRRKKGDVEKAILPKEETIIQVELTRIQKKLYKAFLHENAGILLQQITGSKELPSLQNLMMQLRKVCNHPFLIHDAEDGVIKEMRENNPNLVLLTNTEIKQRAIVESAGKMILIDKLLPKLKADGHKVLIFSQMVRILDIIEDYLNNKHYTYERIDGSIAKNDRESAINRFNEDPDRFIFLLSTKAGGVGINLTAANIVIIYDSDWNPQNDIQAQARCHRIGQKSVVKVYRLITRGTYESQMFERASKKLGLDHVILDGGEFNTQTPMKADEIEKMLREGAYGIFNDDDTELDNFCSADIDQILTKRATVYKEDVVAGGGSIFSKASFNVDQDDLDINAPDFWSKVLPISNSYDRFDDDLHVRKCRQNNENKNFMENPKLIKELIQNLIDHGFKDLSPKNLDNARIILRIALSLVVQNEDDPPIEIEDPMKEFGEITLTIEERAKKIIQRVSYFARLQRALCFVQGTDIQWPILFPLWEDPGSEYALMLGVFNYGWRDIVQLIDDTELGLSKAKPLKRNAIEKRVQSLFEDIEKQFDTKIYFIPENIELMSPEDWRNSHPNLMARDILYEHEFKALFQTITSIGLPKKRDGTIDWVLIRENSGLNFVTVEAVKQVGTDIITFIQEHSINENEEQQENNDELIDFNGYPSLEPFASIITPKKYRKIEQSIKEMDIIYEFLNEATSKHWDLIKDAPRNNHLPEWWGREEDEALIRSIGKYGIFIVSKWVIDPRLPFRQHIPNSFVNIIEKLASSESFNKTKINRPNKDIGDLSYVYRERSRVARALSVIEYVNKRINNINTKKNIKKQENDDTEYIAKPSVRLKIISYGEVVPKQHYFYRNYIFPPGYACNRMFVGHKGTTSKKWYKCEISDGGDQPIFTVTTKEDNGDVVLQDNSLIGLSEKLLNFLGVEEYDNKKLKFGLNLFGLNNPEVIKELTEMKEKAQIPSFGENKKSHTKVVKFEIRVPVYDRSLF
ncbi:SNF2 family N-terminal domain containing protein [Histomonas meleagridis]|uniref:SNF2 family N-terminal domain containing protein n=1 Tax=Histomonas meleagridis TaxID=135588 RepID=UPI00355AA2D4|nr:SNF2 family N-terminal domain containing protein [Histomonas meleagridis]